MKHLIGRIVIIFLLSFAALAAEQNADQSQPPDIEQFSLGRLAENLMEPVNIMADFIQTGSFVIGLSFVFASVVKYFEHRKSPLMVPISTVIFLLISGIFLILLPFLSLFIDTGIHYSLLSIK